jgi:hypothetical protein
MKNNKTARLLLLVWGIFPIFLNAQSNGSLLLISDKTCELLVDGGDKKNVTANQPLKIELTTGEHYLQCTTSEKVEQNQIVTIDAGKQKVIKLLFTGNQSAPISAFPSQGQKKLEPLIVANLNFEIPGQVANVLSAAANEDDDTGLDLPTFYFAFEEGDEVIMDCTLESEKGSIIMEVQTEPEHLPIYSRRDFKKLSNEKFKVQKRGIYKFIFSTNNGWDRKGRLAIKRLPADESKVNFNTTAIKKKKYKTVTIQAPSTYYINSTSNEDFKGGKSRIVIPVSVPPNTMEWYYVVSATRDENEIKKTMQQFRLLGDLNKVISGINPTTKALNIAMDLITRPPGGDHCDVYLTDAGNRDLFASKKAFTYSSQGSRENVTSAAVKVNCCNKGQFYLAVRNMDGFHGIHIGIEVVAIVLEEGYELD